MTASSLVTLLHPLRPLPRAAYDVALEAAMGGRRGVVAHWSDFGHEMAEAGFWVGAGTATVVGVAALLLVVVFALVFGAVVRAARRPR